MSQLQFKSISISNFKTFVGEHKFELERQPGLYYIQGKNLLNPELGANGVGKSTLFDAMVWVLWGKTGRDNKPAAAITPWGTKGKTQVVLNFKRSGTNTFIYRSRNPNELCVSFDGGEQSTITQEDVPGILGMTEEMFRRTLVLGQFGTLFLDLKPEAQAQMFTEALSLDVWMKAVGVANDASKAAARRKDQADADLGANERLIEGIAGEIAETEKAAALFEQDKAARIGRIKAGIGTLEGDLDAFDKAPVSQPKLPDQSKSLELNKQLNAARSALEIALSNLRRDEADLKTADAKLKAFTGQRGIKVCPECKQEISDKEFSTKKNAAQKAADDLVVKVEAHIKASDDQRAAGILLKKKYEDAVAKESEAVEGYDDDLKVYNAYREKLLAIQGELQRQRRALKDEEATANTHEAALGRLRTRRQGYRAEQGDLKEKGAAAAKESAQATFWVDAFREIRLSIIDKALIELEMSSSRHMAMLGLDNWGIRFDTERETQSGKVNYSFTVLLYPPDQPEPVRWESYSGGEAQRLQLSVSMALSEVLLSRAGLSPNLEVYDEPTRGLSSQGVDDLIEQLRDRALELGRAIYFCDHHSLDKGAFDGVLVVEKTKKGSTFRWQ